MFVAYLKKKSHGNFVYNLDDSAMPVRTESKH